MTNRIPTIGFLAAGLDEPYQNTIREGVLEGINLAGGRLISLPGIPSYSNSAGIPHSFFTHEIVSPDVFDGLIIMSTTFSGYLGMEELIAFCKGFQPVPIVSIGLKLPDIPSILIDNEEGMTLLMEHLFLHHGYTRPAFIGGPADHPEAIIRENVFRKVLAQKGIAPDEKLVTHNGFYSGAAELAMKEILSRGIPFDVVVCTNDSMALEAEAVLDEANRTVPQLCAITGFDDILLGAKRPFSLSTVHQPLKEMGHKGASMIMQLIKGETPEDPVLASHLVIRESCGCPENIERAEINIPEKYPETVRRQKEAKRARLLRMIGIRLLGAPDRKEILKILSPGLWDLEAGNVTIVVVPENYRNSTEKRVAPYYCFNPGGEDPEPVPAEYPLKQVFPPGNLDYNPHSCLVCPLNFGEENLGYMIFEERPGVLEIYYTLSLQLANALKVCELEQKRRDYTVNLEKLVDERTRELREEAARRQLAEQEILAISEREQRRIGQDLHDDICQRLAGISILAGALERGWTDPGTVNKAARISSEIRDVISRTKSLSRGLFPVILDKQGLTGALEELAVILDGQTGLRCSFEHRGTPGSFFCPTEMALNLYRIAQEAAHNAVRHSGGTRVQILLEERKGNLTLSVSDDGKGFPAGSESGLGLSTMNYRACLIGAELKFESTVSGTVLTCRLSNKGNV